jgi:plasmid stabilization system protein ParE
MDCAVIYSDVALANLEQITEFIARDNAEVAERFANWLVDWLSLYGHCRSVGDR